MGDTVARSCSIIVAVHSSSASTVNALLLKRPPLVSPHSLREFIWEPFNWPKHVISLSRDDTDFGKHDNSLIASSPKPTQDNSTGIIIQYFLHRPDSDNSILVELEVLSAYGLCPAFNAAHTQTSSNIILVLSSFMRVAPTSEPSRLSNFPIVSVSSTTSCIASIKHLLYSVWTPPCPSVLNLAV